MADATITRQAIDETYGHLSYGAMTAALLADAQARWPERGVTAMTTMWMDDHDIESIIFLARPNVIVALAEPEDSPATELRKAIQAHCKQAAERHGKWLRDNDIASLNRPKRAEMRIDDCTGKRRYVRNDSGYDWLEQLSAKDVRRIGKRYVDNGLHSPDTLAEQVRRITSSDWTDSQAMEWLVGQWSLEDGLRSVASGRIPAYISVDALTPAEFAIDGYQLDLLFSEFGDQHVLEVQTAMEDRPTIVDDAPLGEYVAAF